MTERHGDGAWLVAIVLVALNLRALITSVPPLAVDLAADLQLGAVATGALTTVPVACMGLFAPVAAFATRWAGQSTVLSGGLLLIVVGSGLRGFGGVVGLFTATAVAGIGIAIAGTLLPGLVRARLPHRVGSVTGLYTAALIGGALLSSSLSQPVRAVLDVNAQPALAVWSLPAIVALGAWLIVTRTVAAPAAASPGPSKVSRGSSSATTRMPWRDGSAWLGTAFMGGQSLIFYGSLAWLAPAAMEHGLTANDAGLLLGLFSAAQVVTAFVVPALAQRTGDVRPWVVASVGTATIGLVLVAVAGDAFPGAPWVWVTVLGLGLGSNFSLALTTITHLAPSSAAAPAYTGMAFFVGYLMAAVGPVLLGILVDATGDYLVPFLTLAALGLVTIALGLAAAGRARLAAPAQPARA